MMAKDKRRNGSGNVQRDQEAQAQKADWKEGDFAVLTPSALRMGRLEAMSPRLLHQLGWDEPFGVMHVFETQEDGLCLTLYPCCMRLRDRRTGKFRCTGHPAIYFQKTEYGRQQKKGDKSTSVSLPLIGEILSFDYEEDPQNPKARAKIFGQETLVTGEFARILAKVAEDNKIL